MPHACVSMPAQEEIVALTHHDCRIFAELDNGLPKAVISKKISGGSCITTNRRYNQPDRDQATPFSGHFPAFGPKS